MTIEERKYDLADSTLVDRSENDITLMIWRPEGRAIIIGNSNKAINTVNIEAAAADGVPVYKRPSGGESVVLTENTLIISLVQRHEKFGNTKAVFDSINNVIISGLTKLGVSGLNLRGISDIAIGDKKILGSAMYRNKDKIFYHAVLNVSEDIDVIAGYLTHPEREPAYRSGRSHKEFVTSLSENNKKFEILKIKTILEESFSERFGDSLEIRRN